MRNDFCTGYLAHSAKGKTWDKHKYVAKVKLASGKYYYFYTQAEYDRFLKKVKQRGDAEREKINAKKSQTGEATDTNKKMTAEERRQANIEKVKGAAGTGSSKKSGKSSGSSKKSSSKKSGSSGSSKKSSSSKTSSNKEKTSSGSKSSGSSKEKSSSSKAETTAKTTKDTQTTSQEVQQKQTPSLSTYKYKYDLKDDDIDSYSGAETDRVSNTRVEEIIDDMIDKYPDNASGYLLASFSDSINYEFKWVKEGGTIKLIDPDTGNEIPADTALTNSKNVSLFRADNKKAKA